MTNSSARLRAKTAGPPVSRITPCIATAKARAAHAEQFKAQLVHRAGARRREIHLARIGLAIGHSALPCCAPAAMDAHAG